jgi:hypothetical protein
MRYLEAITNKNKQETPNHRTTKQLDTSTPKQDANV